MTQDELDALFKGEAEYNAKNPKPRRGRSKQEKAAKPSTKRAGDLSLMYHPSSQHHLALADTYDALADRIEDAHNPKWEGVAKSIRDQTIAHLREKAVWHRANPPVVKQ